MSKSDEAYEQCAAIELARSGPMMGNREQAWRVFKDAYLRSRESDAIGWLREAFDATWSNESDHNYLSTACFHEQHGYCAAQIGFGGQKRPAMCKFCDAPCRCSCHSAPQQGAS